MKPGTTSSLAARLTSADYHHLRWSACAKLDDVAFLDKPNQSVPKWRNWQTRQVQDLVPVKGVEVRVLSSAPCAAYGHVLLLAMVNTETAVGLQPMNQTSLGSATWS